MKVILFCQHSYAYGILAPVAAILKEKSYPYIWFTTKNLTNQFPFKYEPHTDSLVDIIKFQSDAIFVPGNYVPHYLRGVKVQVFHGLAGEKKSHFKIRHFFDLYLTQGPYFTRQFNLLKKRHKNFEVVETGWPKLDIYGNYNSKWASDKKELLELHNAKHIVLFAPTHNVNMTSAPYLLEEFKELVKDKSYFVIFKFHDLTDKEIVHQYTIAFMKPSNAIISFEPAIAKVLMMADILVSDTSSVVYEFQYLDKPVLTFKSQATNIQWDNAQDYEHLKTRINDVLEKDGEKSNRQQIKAEYHPYQDGNSALRMVEAVENYIAEKGVPKKRKVSLARKFKIFKIFTLRNK